MDPEIWTAKIMYSDGPKYQSGWWLTYPSEKYESQLGLLFPIYGNIKNVPNHQPAVMTYNSVISSFMEW